MMVRAANRLQCIWGAHCVQLVVPRIDYNVFANYTIYNRLCHEWITVYVRHGLLQCTMVNICARGDIVIGRDEQCAVI